MERDIYAYKCKRCGHVQYPYRTICCNCKKNDHNEFDIVPMAKEGSIVTFTHLYNLPSDFAAHKMTLGIVALDDGNKITGQIDIKEPKIGMRVKGEVKIVRLDEYEKRYGMVFTEE